MAELDSGVRKTLHNAPGAGRFVRDDDRGLVASIPPHQEQPHKCGFVFGKIQNARGNVMGRVVDAVDEGYFLREPLHENIHAINTDDVTEARAILLCDFFISRQRRKFALQSFCNAPEVRSCRSARPRSESPATNDFQSGASLGRKSTEKLCFFSHRYRFNPLRLPHFCVRKEPQLGHCGLRFFWCS